MEANEVQLADPRPLRNELGLFCVVLLIIEVAFFWDALRPGWVLSAADWLLATESFRAPGGPEYEPANRLLTDIACQMEPWMQLAAREWRAGRVPLWNPYAGCGAPLLANAQSGVFYPLNFLYFLTESSYAWVVMAMVKLFIAGMGTFLLASELGLGRLGRWFAGLTFPFSGFVVVWLQYPMGSVAVWLPMVLWLVERILRRPGPWWAGCLAFVVGLMLLAGHPETTAHILLVAGCYGLWRCRSEGRPLVLGLLAARGLRWFALATVVGFLIGAVQILPLAEYLNHSQAWAERSQKVRSVWKLAKPDVKAMPALGAPYVFGSYCRGHPHVEKVFGVENFNEIASGYTGLATITVLVPLSLRARRRHGWIVFFLAVDLVSLAVIYRFPLIDNLVRIIPVLNVMQNQRLLLVVSLAHCLLGGAGLDAWAELAEPENRRLGAVLVGMLAGAALSLGIAAVAVRMVSPQIHERAMAHFEQQARLRGLPPDALVHRAEHQAEQVERFFPRYYGAVCGYAAVLSGMVWVSRRGFGITVCGRLMMVFSLVDLFVFGCGYNPAIPLQDYFPACSITEFLQVESVRLQPEPFRVLVLEEEFPPNVLGRYGIGDMRNYDAIELAGTLKFLSPLWTGPDAKLTSNSWATWDRALACLDQLRLANVRYLISTSEPPGETAGIRLVMQHGRVRVYEVERHSNLSLVIDGDEGTIEKQNTLSVKVLEYRPGHIVATVLAAAPGGRLVLAESFIPGWQARVNGRQSPVLPYQNAFLSIQISEGKQQVEFEYRPASLKVGLALSAVGVLIWGTLLGTKFSCKRSAEDN